jgi:hypothetical protein
VDQAGDTPIDRSVRDKTHWISNAFFILESDVGPQGHKKDTDYSPKGGRLYPPDDGLGSRPLLFVQYTLDKCQNHKTGDKKTDRYRKEEIHFSPHFVRYDYHFNMIVSE